MDLAIRIVVTKVYKGVASAAELVQPANGTMYQAKSSGRNRLLGYSS